MAPFRPEEVTLPVRFICKTIHLIAVLTVVFDVESVVRNMEMIDTSTTSSRFQLDLFKQRKQELEGLSYASLACFGIEYITLFLGVSMFFHRVMSINILCHFAGFILVILFYNSAWSINSYIVFFVVLSVFPALLELATLTFAMRYSFLKY